MQYEKNPPLLESSVAADPLEQFESWLTDARAEGMIEPTAMTLATVGADGRPSARIVLFKGLHDGGLSFYTNYDSHKGREMAQRAQVALVFWWDRLERQVRIEGVAEKLPRALAESYFRQRPRESQLGALTSHQSQVVATREELDARLAESTARFAGADVPCPPNWGGYLVRPASFEFWQGRRGRLHDRLRYVLEGRWRIERLEP
jgi:pyridoxamine 5'-phosphate oxidase